jgi:hypothetical protein
MELNHEEQTPLVGVVSDEKNGSYSKFTIVGAVAALLGTAAVVHSMSSKFSSASSELSEELPEISMVTQNEYGSIVPGSGYYPFKFIVEPHKVTTLVVQEPAELTVLGGTEVSYHWNVKDDATLGWGNTFEHTFTSTGKKEIHLARYVTDLATGEQTQTHHLTEYVSSKYVKRELRSMSDKDREGFLTALQTVYTTSTSDGVSKYGEHYVGIEDLVKAHLSAAGTKDCDHWHDDAGIMVHHLSFTLKMELALQAVDPAVTIPYWEYTIDSATLGGDWRTSKVFSDDWFGNSGDTLDEHHFVKEGRWAYLTIAKDDSFEIKNAYGLLRSPWNLNPDAYVTRHSSVFTQEYMGGYLPNCDIVKSCFESNTISAMNTCLNGATHGPIHVLLGGQWGVNVDEMESKLIGSAQLLLFKTLWRRGYARCPTSLSDIEQGFTSCSISSELIEAQGGAYEVLTTKTGILHWMAATSNGNIEYNEETGKFELAGKSKAYEAAIWDKLLTSLGNPGQVGEMYTSAAPYDPTFWVLHTTAERLLQYRRLKGLASSDSDFYLAFDETWGYDHIDSDSDMGVSCDWTDVDTTDALSMPTCVKMTCEGHNADDVVPFDLSAISSSLSATTTNQEFYDWLSPVNDDIPYVYDTFTYEQCSGL